MSISTIRTYLFFLVWFSAALNLPGYSSTGSLATDTAKTLVRQPEPAAQQELLENDDYQFDRVGPAPETWWDRFSDWFWNAVEDIFSSEGGKVGLTIFEWILIIGVIVMVVLLLLRNDIHSAFYGKSASVPIDFKEFEEDIHLLNFEQMISNAIAVKDYRKAVRLHFLKLLKDLTDQNLIQWQIDKTNNDYSIELKNSPYSDRFSELALLYEYVWYGDFHLDEHNFQSTISKFRTFKIGS